MAEDKQPMKDPNVYPPGWDAEQVRHVIEYYDGLDEDGWIAEDEAAFGDDKVIFMAIPHKLVPEVRSLIANHLD